MDKYYRINGVDVVSDDHAEQSIAIVEGKPVFPGDMLYVKDIDVFDTVIDVQSDLYIHFKDSGPCWKDNRRNNLSWTKPEQKSGWINIYPNNTCGGIYDSKNKAACAAATDLIATIQIRWKE